METELRVKEKWSQKCFLPLIPHQPLIPPRKEEERGEMKGEGRKNFGE
jgi:hypothetical protein